VAQVVEPLYAWIYSKLNITRNIHKLLDIQIGQNVWGNIFIGRLGIQLFKSHLGTYDCGLGTQSIN
jgi:hypothetical protein